MRGLVSSVAKSYVHLKYECVRQMLCAKIYTRMRYFIVNFNTYSILKCMFIFYIICIKMRAENIIYIKLQAEIYIICIKMRPENIICIKLQAEIYIICIKMRAENIIYIKLQALREVASIFVP